MSNAIDDRALFAHTYFPFLASFLADMQIQANHPPPASVPMTAPKTPLPASPVPRLATPRDLVTPFTSERDYGAAAANGSAAFGNSAMGDWNVSEAPMPSCALAFERATRVTFIRQVLATSSNLLLQPTSPGGAYRCPECPYIASSYELLTGHHNERHRTSGITEL